MKKHLIAFACLLTFVNAHAQEVSDPAIGAFSASYTAESSKEYEKAIAEIKNVYSENFYEANLRLGWLYYQAKNYDASQKYYRQAVKLRSSSIEAMLGLVNALAASQNWTEVFSTYQKILAIDPNHSIVNYRIALMYFYRKDFVNAEKHLEKVLDHYPFDYDCLLLMAQTKLAGGKMAEAKAFYKKAQLYNPSSEEIKKALGKL